MAFNFIKPTLNFAIVGLIIPGFTAIGLLGSDFFLSYSGSECSTAIAEVSINESANRDSILIPINDSDTLKFSNKEIKDILRCYPELNSKDVSSPQFTYMKSRSRFSNLDSLSKEVCLSFYSEAGQDAYFVLYAYFLKKQFNSDNRFDSPRQKAIEIFRIINTIFGHLNSGGTYYSHQNWRIVGYAEHSVYRLNKFEKELTKGYDIKSQRQHYINLFNQLIEDEVNQDSGTPSKKQKLEKKMSLLKLTTKLESLITDSFYLNEAIEFQYAHY